METLDSVLSGRLASLETLDRRRELRELRPQDGTRLVEAVGGAGLRNFASNDYLGLASHAALRAAAAEAVDLFGTGAGASRLVCGSLTVHHALERELASFKRTPAALAFGSGYSTALGTVPALVRAGDFVLIDRLAHACLVDGARLSGARLRVFRHNDMDDLARLLGWVDARRASARSRGSNGEGRALIVTESVFSMDGDLAPLRELVALKELHGAWLLVDEAHATGVLGPGGRGAIEALGLTGRVEVAMGTLGKALGAAGGFVAGSAMLTDYLVNRARTFIFSTAPPPAAVGAALAGLQILASPEGAARLADLWARVAELHRGLADLGWVLPAPTSPILPLIVGAEGAALALAAALRAEGVLVPAIRPPTVPPGRARLRLTVSAAHDAADIAFLLAALRRALDRTGVRPIV